VQVWLHSFAFAHHTAERARQAERWGFDGMLVADSQNLNADVWVELALAGAATERLRLGPGVTNPVTRNPAVTASAVATLQEETGGRAVLGLGRGDSALSQIGRKPVPVAELEQALVAIQAYLSGEKADAGGFAARIAWLPEQGVAKVPVHVAATGPHVIAAAARHADGVDFTVGAEPERLRWAVDIAREAAGDREVSLGAYLNVAVDPDRSVARDLVRGSTAIFARFATEGAPADGLSEVTREGIDQVAADYDEAHHGRAKTAHAQALGGDFIDRFAVVGDAAEVTERLREIESLGIERAIVVPGSLDADPGAMKTADERFAAEVVGSL
jgi:5,10-methylenetetrahydromethanopterin reductase